METKGKLNGLSLFSGYAGIDLALADYVRPITYCEIEKYAQGILLSRMDDGLIPFAPIWNDVTTLDGNQFKGLVNIVYGGFPCQDISNAGKGRGLEGERSGLFFEVVRLCKEIAPEFIFLENVAGIRLRGSIEVSESLASIGYDCRFGMLSASEIGANHRRDRWFCLAIRRDVANSMCEGLGGETIASQEENYQRVRESNGGTMSAPAQRGFREGEISESESIGVQGLRAGRIQDSCSHDGKGLSLRQSEIFRPSYWQVEPQLGRVVDGVANRVDRVKALGNGVVPLQVKTAFEILMGIK